MNDTLPNPDAVGTATPVANSDVNQAGFDPWGTLRTKMRVIDEAGRKLGRVSALEHDGASGLLSSLAVRHGLFGRTHTFVVADRVAQVNEQTVVLQMSLSDFLALPTFEGF